MKTLKDFSKAIAKTGVSIFSFVAISCILFGGVLINQSCTQDTIKPLKISEDKLAFSESKQDLALAEFESLLDEVSTKLENVGEKYPYMMIDGDTYTKENNNLNAGELTESIMPLVVGAKKILSTFDISEEDLQKEFSDPNDPRIALSGLFILATQDKYELKKHSKNKLLKCLEKVLGDAAMEIFADLIDNITWTKEGMIDLIKKIVSLEGGLPIRAMILVSQFTFCLLTS